MNPKSTIVFVCEHGAAKSVLAAAYFEKLAGELGLDLRAVARGTNPDTEVSPQTISGLTEDGLAPAERKPQKLTESDMQSARRVLAFCDLPVQFQQSFPVEYWKDVPSVSENYGQARDIIVEHIYQLLKSSG